MDDLHHRAEKGPILSVWRSSEAVPAVPQLFWGQEGEPGAQVHLGAAEGEDASPLCQRCDESGSKGRACGQSKIIQDPSIVMWNRMTLI